MIKTINKKTQTIVALAFLSTILFSCKGKVIYTGYEEESQEYKFSEFLKNTNTFPYEATVEKRVRVIEGFQKLTLGMNKKDVKKIIGKPDGEFFSYDTTRVKTYVGSSWGYYLHRHEAKYANDKYDQVVFIYFDPDEKLYWAKPDNIDMLRSKGGPNLRKR